jgi:hypothetical protein
VVHCTNSKLSSIQSNLHTASVPEHLLHCVKSMFHFLLFMVCSSHCDCCVVMYHADRVWVPLASARMQCSVHSSANSENAFETVGVSHEMPPAVPEYYTKLISFDHVLTLGVWYLRVTLSCCRCFSSQGTGDCSHHS